MKKKKEGEEGGGGGGGEHKEGELLIHHLTPDHPPRGRILVKFEVVTVIGKKKKDGG